MLKGDSYKYLGVLQAQGVAHSQIKPKLVAQYKKRLVSLLKTKLTGGNLVKAINAYAIPALSYSFGLIKWTTTDLESINRTTRVTLTKHRAHHPKSCIERFNLPRRVGGRGIRDVKDVHEKEITGLRNYFYGKEESCTLHKDIINADNNYTIINLRNRDFHAEGTQTEEEKIKCWEEKPLHGKYITTLKQPHVDFNASCEWIHQGFIYPETEGFMCAIQDQVIGTKNYRRYIIKDQNIKNDTCRMCGSHTENIEHIISGCQTLASREYTERHDNVAKTVHNWILHKAQQVQERTPYYKYIPETVTESATVKVYWNRTIITDHHIPHNRPDIVYVNKEKNEAYLIDIAIPAAHNIKKKYAEKIGKYVPLAAEIKELWGLETVHIIPIILGATGEIPTTLHQSLKELDLPPKLYMEMQKAVILSTCNIVRKVLNIKA